MSTRKPDRFDRIAKLPRKDYLSKLMCEQECAELLRAEHRWVRNMVRKCLREADELIVYEQHDGRLDTAYGWLCRKAQCQQIIDELEVRAK